MMMAQMYFQRVDPQKITVTSHYNTKILDTFKASFITNFVYPFLERSAKNKQLAML